MLSRDAGRPPQRQPDHRLGDSGRVHVQHRQERHVRRVDHVERGGGVAGPVVGAADDGGRRLPSVHGRHSRTMRGRVAGSLGARNGEGSSAPWPPSGKPRRGRVEDWRGSGASQRVTLPSACSPTTAVPRFQPPLIQPCVRFSRTRLSEIVHRAAVGVADAHATVPLRVSTPRPRHSAAVGMMRRVPRRPAFLFRNRPSRLRT